MSLVPPAVLKTAFGIFATFQIVLIVLYGLTYAYIDKMERAGCACSVHPYRNFVKMYPLFAIGYLVLTIFAPLFIGKSSAFAMVMQLLNFMFTIGSIIFFITAIKYAEYLIREKCRCSEDTRREMLYYWSIVHLGLILAGVVLVLIGILLSSMTLTSLASAKTVQTSYADASKSVRNPVSTAMSIPSRLKKITSRR